MSKFLLIIVNPAGGYAAPIEVKEPNVVFAQILGVSRQAGIVSAIKSVIKYVKSL
jgi:hypothetical protein